ncbi:hypothetical protein [Thauera sinica]|uniref:Uncharacterized protein n=1 Tax=Thauera sinica TaxID=2665146 RepID=A0ABW1AKK1_9RHOO|nr:hypothetical protein [Thauera sp. K11]
MNTPIKVAVSWDAEKMEQLPTGGSYITAAKFMEDAEAWQREGWSIALAFQPEDAKKRNFAATARFLVSDAPWGRLKKVGTFELYEGNRKTATVTVL